MNVYEPLVSIIVVNFNGEKYISDLIENIFNQKYKNIELILLDNCSNDNSIEIIESSKYRNRIKLIKSLKNMGFAKGNNKALEYSTGDYLLFLNTDAFLEKDALTEMIRAAKSKNDLGGIAPKIYLSRFLPKKIFDSVGICIDYAGSPYNRGIGQVDMTQYDHSEEVMGLCFACALVPKDVYINVGKLDDSYFAYFEDVDWSFRARKMGYKFYTAPKSIVNHAHSATSSSKSYAWKYYLIFRNYLRTATKTFGKKNALKIVCKRLLSLIKMSLFSNEDTNLRYAALKVVVNYVFFDWYLYLFKRIKTRNKFNNDILDEYLFQFSINEPSSFFDPVTYQPIEDDIKLYKHVVRKKIEFCLFDLEKKLNRDWKLLEKRYYSSKYSQNVWKKEYQDFISELF